MERKLYYIAESEAAIRSLWLFPACNGYEPLIYMVDKILNGRKLDAALKRETAARLGFTTKQVWGYLRSLSARVRRLFPEQYAEWFGSTDARVSPDQFVQAVAGYARKFPPSTEPDPAKLVAYDAMPAEKLKELLRKDQAIFPDSILSPEEVLYIADLVGQAEGTDDIDIEKAWQNFLQYYYSPGEPREELDDDEE